MPMPMPEPVLRLEQAHQLHVLEVAGRPEGLEPVLDGLAVLLFDGRKARGRALPQCLSRVSRSANEMPMAESTKVKWITATMVTTWMFSRVSSPLR